MLKEKLAALKKELIEYYSFVESMFDKSIKGLQSKEVKLLQELIEKDEPRANNEEIRLDDLCTVLIAQYEPRAVDLRTVLMILKMNNDLERIADHAVNIAQGSLFLIERPSLDISKDILIMSKVVKKMLSDSINSFINWNTGLAREVCERDKAVNQLRDSIIKGLITCMIINSENIARALQLLRITTNLERIADLTTNICEDVIFMIEGRVIKHHHLNHKH